MKRMLAACVIMLAVFAVLVGTVALVATTSTPAMAKCGICPMYCSPVLCDNGKVYCNTCLAACAGAGHCVPLFPPIPL
jgi:hypothetical protein